MSIVVPLPGQEPLAEALASALAARTCAAALRRFPDGESHARLLSPQEIAGCDVVLAATLDRPDEKLVPLALVARACRDAGARRVVLAAPYLAYMRQDCVFSPGEGVASRAFGALLSAIFDGLCTIDPHLHRHASLGEILSIPSRVASASGPIASWIRSEVPSAVVVGPDEEAEQWARSVADLASVPSLVLRKRRLGDRAVEIEAPASLPEGRVPVIVDDILSTGGTLVQVVGALRRAGAPPPVAVAVHAVFAEDPRARLREAGLARLVTCNTIAHETQAIDVVPPLAEAVRDLLSSLSA